MSETRGAIFLDRDGVLNEDIGYLHRPEDLVWIEGASDAVRLINAAGLFAVVVTNQSGVARGYYSEADIERLHEHMARELAARGARIDAFYACPYHSDGADPRYIHPNHPDRKPNPGMLLRAMSDLPIDAARSLIIGDKESDLEAGRRAGVRGALFQHGSLEAFVRAILITVAVTAVVR